MKTKPATYFSADHHFGHEGVIRMCGRPYSDAREMDEALVRAWNARVRPVDTIWFLGDFAMGSSPERCGELFARLNGTKHLVRGNHDGKRVLELPWASQHDLVQVTVDGVRLVLCHYAMRSWNQVWRGSLHLYGHTHNTLPPTTQSCDVGVDAWDFRPVTIAEIQERLAGVGEEPEEMRRARETGEDDDAA
ncbi:metallophosphoesterase family protein [Methylobacterium oryzae]|uniref:metallophosphoesterase family protein n=1 Tax=Methylobacterium oryzae TaxID=334852 RepID=UPI002F320554